MIVEKRRHIRVDDRLVMSWRPVGADSMDIEDTRDVMRASVNREIHRLLNDLSQSAPDVAKILQQLNHKLDLIADNGHENRYGPNLTPLNISQSGVAFEWRDSLPTDQPIRLTINLPPDNLHLHIKAHVVECRPRTDSQRVVVRCVFLPDQERATDLINNYINFVESMASAPNKLLAPERDELGGAISDYR